MSMEQIELKKKLKNVVISNVPEAPSNLVGDQRLAHDIQYLSSDKVKMNQYEIFTCFRAGRVQKK